MKYFSLILIAMTVLFSSCHNNSEPPVENTLAVIRQYAPATVLFQRSDKEFCDKIHWLNEKDFVVNSLSELPNDNLGFSNAYKGIDFEKYTLLLYYRVHDWNIDTFRNLYYRNNIEQNYNWNIHLGTSTIPDANSETLRITRFAILVHKIPENVEINIWTSLSAIDWDWEE